MVRLRYVYYGGVVAMVGFWLAIGEPLALDNWLLFAAAYAPLVLYEPLFTCLVLRACSSAGRTPRCCGS